MRLLAYFGWFLIKKFRTIDDGVSASSSAELLVAAPHIIQVATPPPAAPIEITPLDSSFSMHEKRMEDCTVMSKRLEEIVGSLAECKERISELHRTKCCFVVNNSIDPLCSSASLSQRRDSPRQ